MIPPTMRPMLPDWSSLPSTHPAPGFSAVPEVYSTYRETPVGTGVAGPGKPAKRGTGVTDFQGAAIAWRKSTASGGTNCVEVAFIQGQVLIRNSANPEGGVLSVLPADWNAFVEEVRTSDREFH